MISILQIFVHSNLRRRDTKIDTLLSAFLRKIDFHDYR